MRRRGQKKGWLRSESGSWLLGYRLYDAAGDAHRETATIGPSEGRGHLTRHQAETVAWNVYLSKAQAIATQPKITVTVRQFWHEKYWPWALTIRKIAASTQTQYEPLYHKWILPVIGDLPMAQVRLEQVERILADVRDAGRAPDTVKAVRKVGSAVFSRAIALEYFIGLNPFQQVHLPRSGQPVRERYALTPEQARGVLDHELWGSSPAVYRLAVHIGLLTGMNAAELVGLRGENITPDCIQVRGQYYRGTWGTTKTVNRRRDIPITDAIRGVLGKLGGGVPCGDPVKAGWLDMPVFQSRAGTPISEHNVQRRYLLPIGEALGLASFGWHILRHTFSSWCEDAGMLESDRQYVMGHAPATMTARYTHEDRRRMAAGLERVAAKLEERPATGGKLIVMRRAV